jgi:hypothetical protein
LYIGKRQFFVKVHEEYLQIYKTSSNPKIAIVQKEYVQQSFILSKAMRYLYICCFALTLIYPLLASVITNERTLPFGFILPWMEPYGNPGFFLNFVHHTLQVFYVGIGVIVSDLIYVHCIILAIGNMTIMKLMLDDLNEQSHQNDAEKLEKISENLMKIIEMHQNLMEYGIFVIEKKFSLIFFLPNSRNIRNLSRNYKAFFFVHIGSLAFQLTITMLACLSVCVKHKMAVVI